MRVRLCGGGERQRRGDLPSPCATLVQVFMKVEVLRKTIMNRPNGFVNLQRAAFLKQW